VLVPLLSVTGLFKSTLEGFLEMNRALKSRAEQETSDWNPAVLTGSIDSVSRGTHPRNNNRGISAVLYPGRYAIPMKWS